MASKTNGSADQAFPDLASLSRQEAKQNLVHCNKTRSEYPQEKCVHQLFEAQAQQTPDAVAVVFQEQKLTYGELNARANQLAHYLKGLGVGPEVIVGICVDRSLEMIVGLLGILKAGGAYLPLDPTYAIDRLNFMVEDAQVPVLLTQQHCLSKLPSHQAQVICLDADWDTIAANTSETPTSEVTSNNLIYVIYTSGSTGKPKGVMMNHRSICNHLFWRQRQFGLTAEDKALQNISLSFDPSVWQIFWTLCFGAQLVLPKPGGHQDGAYLAKMILEQQITVFGVVPSMLRLLLEEEGIESCQHLKHVTCGGEALSGELIERFFERLGLETVLHNLYGPTEAAIDATFWTCQRGTNYQIAPIGQPIANAQTYILDADLQPVPVGDSGELYIGGDGLARGYLNRSDLTAEKFIPHPFSDDPTARLYKTGDLARYLPDGNIEFLGRVDYQVKIRGFRIELGEIEAILSQHPRVEQGVVIAREDEPGNKRLVAYIVTAEGESPTPNELRQFLKQTLPDHMIPAAFVQLKSFPLTPNGKIDRQALPKPEASDLASSVNYVAPRTSIEQQLVEIWQELLGIHPIGIHDNFFDLGGHSLLAARLSAQIEKGFGKKLMLSTMVTAPTIAQLAEILTPSTQSFQQESIVLLKEGNPGIPPIFLIHELDGETILYRSLAQSLDPAIPVYGIQPYGRDGYPILHTRLADMADYFLEQICQIQPEGPYFLGGLCVGGVLAFEVAQRLQQQGQTVGMVALLDAGDVNAPARSSVAEQRWQSFSASLSGDATLGRYERWFHTVQKIGKKATNLIQYETQQRFEQFRDRIQLNLLRYYIDRGLPLPKFLQGISIGKVIMWAYESHDPQGQFKGEVLLFRATEKSSIFDETEIDDTPKVEEYSDPLFGWGDRVTQGVQVHDVPGGHSSMLQKPNVKVMADIIQAYYQTQTRTTVGASVS